MALNSDLFKRFQCNGILTGESRGLGIKAPRKKSPGVGGVLTGKLKADASLK